jgi:hypothetical protein
MRLSLALALLAGLVAPAWAACTTVTLDDAPAGERAATVVPAPAPPATHERSRAQRAATAPTRDAIDDVAHALRTLAPDPAPASITNDKHYLVSNERRLDLYRPDVDDLGGVYLGVGTDQNYIMAGFVKPSLVVIVDFDQAVVDLHAVHGALVRAAPDAEQFLHTWSRAGEADALAILDAAFEEPARRSELRELYLSARPEVERRFRDLRKRYAELGIQAWLEVPEQYDTVRDLFERERVVAIRGDFTRAGVMRDIAAILEEHGQIVRVLYLSNIEQYLAYRPPWKANMLALPLDDRSLVLRTLPGRPAGFQYILQRGHDFQTWMRAPKVWTVYRMRGLVRGEHLVASERFFIEALPGTSARPLGPRSGGA